MRELICTLHKLPVWNRHINNHIVNQLNDINHKLNPPIDLDQVVIALRPLRVFLNAQPTCIQPFLNSCYSLLDIIDTAKSPTIQFFAHNCHNSIL